MQVSVSVSVSVSVCLKKLSPVGIKMTGLKRNSKQKPLFQNMKMCDRIQNWTKKSLNSERDIVEDILEIVSDMKRTVNLIEDIAKQLQAKLLRETNDTERLIDEDSSAKDISQEELHPSKCMFCSDRFKNISELEKHIKGKHAEYDTFECETCGKKFVTKFRFEKHEQMHLSLVINNCHYFRRNKPCPFEELGCKFRHELDNTDDKTIGHHVENVNAHELDETDKQVAEETIEVIKSSELDAFDSSFEKTSWQTIESFHASTPKKTFPCESCEIDSECVDCFVVHTLGMHGIARAVFP